MIFKTSKKLVDNPTFYLENLKKAISRVLNSYKLLLKDAEIFNQHPDLTICARDNYSYDLLKKYFVNNKILLLPDMAFASI
jgi:exopolysaccharide biosynthesis predicted pyruvyltransferase EpsI